MTRGTYALWGYPERVTNFPGRLDTVAELTAGTTEEALARIAEAVRAIETKVGVGQEGPLEAGAALMSRGGGASEYSRIG